MPKVWQVFLPKVDGTTLIYGDASVTYCLPVAIKIIAWVIGFALLVDTYTISLHLWKDLVLVSKR